MKAQEKTNRGYVMLMAVIVLGAITGVITVSLLLHGIAHTDYARTSEYGVYAYSLAEACAEEGLQQIRSTTTFSGPGNLTLGLGSCSYNVIDTGAQTRTINATGVFNFNTRRIQVTIDGINPFLTVTSWQEVAAF